MTNRGRPGADAELSGIILRFCPGATDKEIRELLSEYRRQGKRNIAGFLNTIGSNGGLARDLESLREKHRKTVTADAVQKLRQEAECPHGDPGGAAIHPVTGWPLCPQCRAEAKDRGENPRTAEISDIPAPAIGETDDQDGAETPASLRRLVLTRASDIAPRPVIWGWTERLPAGHLSLLPGREGIGKSLFMIWLTAQITRGMLPGIYEGSPRPVFYCATEDSWQCTIVPRLIAAGADLELVYKVEIRTIGTTMGNIVVELSLPRDCDLLAAEIRRLGVAMVALDPLMSSIDRAVDTYNDREMRTVLEPIARLADETGTMFVGLAHFNKSADIDPLNLVTGSRAFTAVTRAVIAIARDPDADDGGCVVSQVKNNLGRLDLPNLTYVINAVRVKTDEGDTTVPRLHFTGESPRSVRDILADAGSSQERTARTECAAWLTQRLASGPERSKIIEKESEAQEFKRRTYIRARQLAGVKAEQRPTGPKGRTEWWSLLPGTDDTIEPGSDDAS